MHFRTILVDLREDHARAARIEAAARLAAQTGGSVVGLTATGTQNVLVAGGYGRPRLRELVLGGTTRGLLHQAALPVFLSR